MNLNATLLIQVISFLILLGSMTWILYKPLQKLLDERIDKVKSDIENAQKLLAEAEENRKAAQNMLHQAQQEAILLRRKAEQDADAYYREQVQKTKADINKMIEDANREIQEQVKQAKLQLRKEVADLAVSIAKKILKKEISSQEHEQIIREAIEGIVNG